MPRQKKNCLEDGLLTIPVLSKLISMSLPTVRNLADSHAFPGTFRIPGTKERRIPAPSVVRYLRATGIPVPTELLTFSSAYEAKYGTPTP